MSTVLDRRPGRASAEPLDLWRYANDARRFHPSNKWHQALHDRMFAAFDLGRKVVGAMFQELGAAQFD